MQRDALHKDCSTKRFCEKNSKAYRLCCHALVIPSLIAMPISFVAAQTNANATEDPLAISLAESLEMLRDLIEPAPLEDSLNYLLIASLAIFFAAAALIFAVVYKKRQAERSISRIISFFEKDAQSVTEDLSISDVHCAHRVGANFKVALCELLIQKPPSAQVEQRPQKDKSMSCDQTNARRPAELSVDHSVSTIKTSSYTELTTLFFPNAHVDQKAALSALDASYQTQFSLGSQQRGQLAHTLTQLLKNYSARIRK